MYAFTGANILAASPRTLVQRYLDLKDDVSRHYAVCPDQEEKYGCRECETLNTQRYEAQRAMEADPAAVALYNSPEVARERRERSRYVIQFYEDTSYMDEAY